MHESKNRDSSAESGSGPSQQAAHQRPYQPNYISLDTRATCLAVSALLICYALASIAADDFLLWIPSRRGDITIHLHGVSVWIASAAVGCACASMLSFVVDHHDERDNEESYRKFAKLSLKIGCALLALAVILDLFVFQTGSFHRNR